MKLRLGNMIDHFRKARGMTMDDVGEKLDKTTSTVSRWISGERSPKVEDLIKLTNIFNTDVNTLLYGEDSLSKNQYYKFYADDILSLNIEHFFNLNDEHYLKIPITDLLMGKNKGQDIVITKMYDTTFSHHVPLNCYIGLDLDYRQLINHDLVLCYADHTIQFKQYLSSENKQKITLKNADDSTSVFNKNDVLILARITSVFSQF